jgi:hypothetical protein
VRSTVSRRKARIDRLGAEFKDHLSHRPNLLPNPHGRNTSIVRYSKTYKDGFNTA